MVNDRDNNSAAVETAAWLAESTDGLAGLIAGEDRNQEHVFQAWLEAARSRAPSPFRIRPPRPGG